MKMHEARKKQQQQDVLLFSQTLPVFPLASALTKSAPQTTSHSQSYLIACGKPAGHREVAPREFDVDSRWKPEREAEEKKKKKKQKKKKKKKGETKTVP